MKQLILPGSFRNDTVSILSQEDSHYLLRVQRKNIGYALDLLDQEGNKFRGTIVEISDGLCHLELELKEQNSTKNRDLILFQSIPKGKKIDLMIRQSVEIGISAIVPIIAEYSIPKFGTKEDKEKKRDRWNKIIKEASQQSGTEMLTVLEPLQNFKQALDSIKKPYTGIFFHQIPLETKSLHSILSNPKDTIVLVIGPEGGLSEKEVNLLLEYNFFPALLGHNILRAETATTFALGAVQMILNEQDSWIVK